MKSNFLKAKIPEPAATNTSAAEQSVPETIPVPEPVLTEEEKA